ncbi:MAG: 30S ribosomal protein S21 [Lewinellaceae bacterium]|nr:30S ribosomal protein S21 [Lewinellaceae bacterium]MCB9286237.1 30S ribosomal protein S21 [Lewinellaceae bacterium]
MIIIEVKEGESIDRALKRYKRKHRNVGVVKELRKRQQFTKPSVRRRNELLKAQYLLQKLQGEQED